MKKLPSFRQCAVSVMDTLADPDIYFDDHGISNYYYEYRQKNATLPIEKERQAAFEKVVERIKSGRRGRHDCIMGLSGGIDSTYIAWLAKQAGLRPLAVHFDNGWNTALAEENIRNIIRHTGFDFVRVSMDNSEYRDIQHAYLKASVVDIEAPTDHAIFSTLYRFAVAHNISYLLSGTNHQTEATMPRSWNFNKRDHVNIRAIYKAFGSAPMKTFPLMDAAMKRQIRKEGVESISLLHYVYYNKQQVTELLQREFGWKAYDGKHAESIWTRFYQEYILPEKFGIDKRKAHLSDLIFGGQITKEEAIASLKKPIYDPAQLEEDKRLVLERLEMSEAEFGEIMDAPVRSHYDFDYEMPLDRRCPALRPVKKLYRTFFPVR